MKISSPRHLSRLARLQELIAEAGNATALSVKVGTPKSHISALLSGQRGIGDALAAKLERKCGKPVGWMDQPAGRITMAELNGWEGQLVTLFRQLGPDTQHDMLLDINNKVAAKSTSPSSAAPFARKSKKPA